MTSQTQGCVGLPSRILNQDLDTCSGGQPSRMEFSLTGQTAILSQAFSSHKTLSAALGECPGQCSARGR